MCTQTKPQNIYKAGPRVQLMDEGLNRDIHLTQKRKKRQEMRGKTRESIAKGILGTFLVFFATSQPLSVDVAHKCLSPAYQHTSDASKRTEKLH